jgi:hypothetical protein
MSPGRDLDSNRTLLGQNANVGLIRYNGSTCCWPRRSTANGYTALQMSQAFRTYEDVGNITDQHLEHLRQFRHQADRHR